MAVYFFFVMLTTSEIIDTIKVVNEISNSKVTISHPSFPEGKRVPPHIERANRLPFCRLTLFYEEHSIIIRHKLQ